MQCTEARFLSDVSKHEMQVLRDEGVYRHLRFKAPGTMMEHFDLVTWPGTLCYSGDMGTYVFERTTDMFSFFRTPKVEGVELYIKPGYWAEKAEGIDRFARCEEFDDEAFTRAVLKDLVEWLRANRDDTTKEERRELWESVVTDVIHTDSDAEGARKQIAAYDYGAFVNDVVGEFYFQDFSEHSLTRYTSHFLWCCYALVWGIRKYDAWKAEQVLAAA